MALLWCFSTIGMTVEKLKKEMALGNLMIVGANSPQELSRILQYLQTQYDDPSIWMKYGESE